MTEYDATQKQRAIERRIRATKRDLSGLDAAIKETDNQSLKESLQAEFDRKSVLLKKQEAKIKEFTHQTGLYRDRTREQSYGFNKSVSQKSVWSNKKVYNSAKEILKTPNITNSLETFNKLAYNPNGDLLKELSQLSYEDALKLKVLYNDRVVRSWYKKHIENIINEIDKSQTIEKQALEAFEKRNLYKMQARSLMFDENSKQKLDEEEPIKTFIQLMIEKSARKQIAGIDLYKDIINSSSKSRKSVNKKYGLE